jgi:hypothetical protein
VTGPHGGAPTAPAPVGPPHLRPGRPSGRVLAALLLALVGLVGLGVAAALVVDGRQPSGAPSAVSLSPGDEVPLAELEGEWSGEGSLTRCAGFEDEDCAGTRAITLTIDCSSGGCSVTPVDRGHGSPPLRFEDGIYRAAGPVPPDDAPTCGGVPTRSALWRLELTARDGRLSGSYAESTVQGFDCGATNLEWGVVLERS